MAANHPLQQVIGATPRGGATLPETTSFFTISEPNVLISTIKKGEDDNSVIVRLYDMEGRDSKPVLGCFLPIREVNYTNLIEQENGKVDYSGQDVQVPVGHHAIETLKLNPQVEKAEVR